MARRYTSGMDTFPQPATEPGRGGQDPSPVVEPLPPSPDAFAASSAPTSPVAASTAPRQRGTRFILAAALGASMLSASAASVATVALVKPASAPAVSSTTATQTSTGSSSAETNSSDAIVNVAARVSPAVVTITSESAGSSDLNPFSVPSTGVGSGFIYDSSGLILTNYHVVEGAGQLTVALNDGRELPGKVVASDPDHDLAVVKVDATGLPTVTIGSSASLKVGQLVVAIGSPLGTFTDSVTSGILSATGRSITVRDASTRQRHTISNLLQTDAAINEGNSGGPLLDAAGQAIGINTAAAASAEGIGFAIPIDQAASIMASARSGGNASG